MNVRPPAAGDLAELLALSRAADEAVWGDSDWTERDLREYLEEVDADSARDGWVVELDGRIAGWATFEARDSGLLIGDGYVHPELAGRGVGSRLIDLYESRAARTPGGVGLESAALLGDGAADALFRLRGFAPAGRFVRMLVEHDRAPEPPRWPDGIEARPFRLGEAEALHAAHQEAFAEERNFRPQAFGEWAEQRLDRDGFDPSLTWVAWADGEVAGFSLNDAERHGTWGWIGAIGVRPAWRRRGLGEALLRASFAEFWTRGERRVALSVDADNVTGATRLYERVGMDVLWQSIVYRKELNGGG